jgi:hypothetical protein
MFPDLGFRDVFEFTTTGEPIVVCDPIAIADIFNDSTGDASFLRSRAVFLTDMGGETSGPVRWAEPYLILRVATNSESELDAEARTLVDDVRTDSGCFMFLPLDNDTPEEIRAKIVRATQDGDVAVVNVPPGGWTFFYEQLVAPAGSAHEFYRNVVGVHSAPV